MSYGLNVYNANGELVFTEDGGIACFAGESSSRSTSMRGNDPLNVWSVVSAVVDEGDVEILEWNMPANVIWHTSTTIEFDVPPTSSAKIFWGVA